MSDRTMNSRQQDITKRLNEFATMADEAAREIEDLVREVSIWKERAAAERERCAGIVDANAIEFERQASEAADGLVHDAMLMASDALELTASAIREGGEA
ncbi:hypothetical protein [Rhizobium phage RHEph18]|uniref:hypothetical protein n=1 Tax=Rhizobium TaxID=379 RepID=UPI0007EB12E8|nr:MULTISPECIES: hypothetical protein [Rhizobium]ANL02665.1 hypothetical protein AMJ99_CH01078 [Rhizobium esperanzae]ANM33517.1 hypothetical protein AMK04_CH01079 [Rhizobium sp. N871]QIG73749.1 hypothetical protein EVC05_057 [Rhizobium phage RHph_N2]QXV74467.1 hypothetical protein [Rhizobium phage RHEph18]